MDVQMPVLDGLEATARSRAQLPPDRQPRIVAMTANALAEDRDRCLAAGMDDHVAKPVRLEELEAALLRVPGAADGPAPAAAGRGEPPLVDAGPLDALTGRAGDRGPALRETLLSTWREETRARLGELADAAGRGDAERAAALAHTVRGGSASLGAERVALLCRRLEDDVRAGRPADLPAAARELAGAYDATVAAFSSAWGPPAA